MHTVLLLGAGKIGRAIANFLQGCGDYAVTVADADAGLLAQLKERLPGLSTRQLDAGDRAALEKACKGQQSVVSALSFGFNPLVAEVACAAGASYFDLTEDVQTTRAVRLIAQRAAPGQVFMPQCGLAPGFVSVAAFELTRGFEKLDRVYMRVGALPQFPSNALKYNLTWSTDGLINEYCNPCEAIHQGRHVEILALEGLEHFSIDGVRYEAFNTSGGLGSLCDTLEGQVTELNYKTIRYLGHRDLMAFLISGMRLGERRELLKEILENAVPITYQDVVVVFCTVAGWRQGRFVQVTDARKIYNGTIPNPAGRNDNWSAIQITTAAGLCAMLDLHAQGQLQGQGLLRQEQVGLADFLNNRFGSYYQSQATMRFAIGTDAGMVNEV
jgi:saccharopine dehydrogenase-like NADP-dependent oxidoreductase